MNQLNPGARWIFRLNAYSKFSGLFVLLLLIAVKFIPYSLGFLNKTSANSILYFILAFILLFIIAVIVFGEIYARLAYNNWGYEITRESIKIERGIIWKKYTSIPYERVQNVDIKRGIIARIFGFSSVEIETAGNSNYSSRKRGRYHSEGYLPGISMEGAEKIAEFISKKIKHLNSEGI